MTKKIIIAVLVAVTTILTMSLKQTNAQEYEDYYYTLDYYSTTSSSQKMVIENAYVWGNSDGSYLTFEDYYFTLTLLNIYNSSVGVTDLLIDNMTEIEYGVYLADFQNLDNIYVAFYVQTLYDGTSTYLNIQFCLYDVSLETIVVTIANVDYYSADLNGYDPNSWRVSPSVVVLGTLINDDFVPTGDYTEGFNDGYTIGYQDGSTDTYDSAYDEGFDHGKEVGDYNQWVNGYNEGLATADNDFSKLFTGIADTPIIIITSLLSFEIFGVEVFQILFSLLTILIMVWLIKKFMI